MRLPEEVAFFGRSGIFGFALAAIYWFLSYELVGTFLLGGFGLATGAAFLLLRAGARRGEREPKHERDGATFADTPSPAPFEDEGGPVPRSSAAPLWVGFGVGVASLSLAYGFWFVLAGLLPILLGAADWLGGILRTGNLERE